MGVLGSKSGREMDKMHDSGLTPRFLDQGITFKEAKYALGMHSETNSENARGAFSLFVGSNFS